MAQCSVCNHRSVFHVLLRKEENTEIKENPALLTAFDSSKEISEKNVDDSKNDVEDQLRYMTEAKNKAEKEKARLETNLEKMKQLQKPLRRSLMNAGW